MEYNSPLGKLWIIADTTSLLGISFTAKSVPVTKISEMTAKELDEYFSRKRKIFDLPISLIGTEFQKKVWRALQKIPYGELRTYKDISFEVDRAGAFRAVGMANNKNPIPIIVPCHRVIGSNGGLTGYAGGLEIKRKLLALEQGGTSPFAKFI